MTTIDPTFIPSTNLVEGAYVATICEMRGDEPEIHAEFERWLAAVKADAWTEGYRHAYVVGVQEGQTGEVVEYAAPNPYRSS